MSTATSEIRAVLTGDIVRSSLLNPDDRKILFEAFPNLSALLRKKYPREITTNISNFRGDGWQLVVDEPLKALEISVFIRTYLRFSVTDKQIDSRIAIGIGGIEFAPENNVSAGYGAAYTISGRLLEEIPGSQRMRLGFASSSQSLTSASAINLVELMDVIIMNWGVSQCQAVYWALQGLTQAEIGERWKPNPITQPSVSSSIRRAGWLPFKNAITHFEQLLGCIINSDQNAEPSAY